MISKINMAQDDNTWWIDTRATKHVCKDKNMFTKFTQCENDNVLYMEILPLQQSKAKGLLNYTLLLERF